MSEDDVTLELDDAVKKETEKAILVFIDGDEYWVPKSVITDDSEVWSKANGSGNLVVQRWWARKQGLCD